MKTFLKALAHYLLIIPKVFLVGAVGYYHILQDWIKVKDLDKVREPNPKKLKQSYEKIDIDSHLADGYNGKTLVIRTPHIGDLSKSVTDHSSLRHGSLCWSKPTEEIINGMANYIDTEHNFVRGLMQAQPPVFNDHHGGTPPAMAMSVAFGLACGHKYKVPLQNRFIVAFCHAVDKEIAKNFNRSDASVDLKPETHGFGSIYALSLLYTAYQLSKEKKYLREANKILWLKGFAAFLLAPVTYFKWRPSPWVRKLFKLKKMEYGGRRNFIDHVSMFGLWTAYQMAPNFVVKKLLQHAIRFVGAQSDAYLQPYYAALQMECDVLPEAQRFRVLSSHHSVNIQESIELKDRCHLLTRSFDWSHFCADEFTFDDFPRGKTVSSGPVKYLVPLNGLCLARSLMILQSRSSK